MTRSFHRGIRRQPPFPAPCRPPCPATTAAPGAPHGRNAKLSPARLATSASGTVCCPWAPKGSSEGPCPGVYAFFAAAYLGRGENRTLGEISLEKRRISCPICVGFCQLAIIDGGGAAASNNTHFCSQRWQCSGGRRVRYHHKYTTDRIVNDQLVHFSS